MPIPDFQSLMLPIMSVAEIFDDDFPILHGCTIPTRRASQPLPHFLERADARDFRESPDRLAAVCESHKFVPVHC